MPETTPGDRLVHIAKAIASNRKRDSDGVVFETDSGRLRYADRTITLELTPSERERLLEVLQSFPVFKIDQPATRKAPANVVHIAAIADPKHTADFIERLFRRVYDNEKTYELRVVRS